MEELDFTLELSSEDLHKQLELQLFAEAEKRLRALAAKHTDMTGAAIMMRHPAHEETPIHTANITVYCRPEHINASETAREPQTALAGALAAVERQIRQRREKLKKHWEQPGNSAVDQEMLSIALAETSEGQAPVDGKE